MGEPRLLVVMGSGETTPTMVSTHQRVLEAVGPGADAALFDTPYGFQENADEITARALTYFRRNVGHEVRAVRLPRPETASPTALEAAHHAAAAADWVFAGPGSPSYLLRQWQHTRLRDRLAERLRTGSGATVFASAAAVTLGSHAVPVYEIYKVGADPHWLPGLDVLAPLGLPVVVVPHYDNAEGGTHDTRYCYLGERRLRRLESQLPEGTAVLGVDEHTAAVIDLVGGSLTVEGRGGVTVRRGERSVVHPSGATVALDRLLVAGPAAGAPAAPPAPQRATESTPAAPEDRSPLRQLVDASAARFERALAGGDATTATDAALELHAGLRAWEGDTQQSDDEDHGHAALRSMVARLGRLAADGLHDHRDVVAPHVDALLQLRARARDDGRYDDADRIRDELKAAGVEVRDTADGSRWDMHGERTSADG